MAGGGHDLSVGGPAGRRGRRGIFDPSTGTFRATGSLNRPRLLPVAVSVDDRVLVLGHLAPWEDDPVTGASSEWYE